MSYAALLVQRCTIERNMPTNTDGEIRAAWTDVATDVPCLIQEGPGQIRQTDGGQGLEYDAVAFFPWGTDLRPQGTDDRKDRVKVTTPATHVRYLIQKIGDEAGRAHHLEAYLTRVPAA